MNVGGSGHHVPAVRKSQGRPFAVSRTDKTRPTLHFRGNAAVAHHRLHAAERAHVGKRQGDFHGTDSELFDAYREAYKGLDDIKLDVASPNGTFLLGRKVTPWQAVCLVEEWLIKRGLHKIE
jgi:hypothetical protein